MAKVLILEDQVEMRRALNRMTLSAQHEVIGQVGSVSEAIDVLHWSSAEILVADVGLPEVLLPLLHYLRTQFASMRVLLISGTPKKTLIEQGKILDHLMFLQKPFTYDQYTSAIEKLLEA